MPMEEEVDKVGGCQLETPAASPSPSLPDEMVFEFLLRLPIKNLHRCNCVSKGWRSLIGSPGFIQAYRARHPDVGLLVAVPDPARPSMTTHFDYSTITFSEPADCVSYFQVPRPDYDFDGATEVIHGLVCFYNRTNLLVCNIFTGEVMPLPHPLPQPGRPRKYFFGFDVVNSVYKLLGISPRSIEILTLGTGSDCCWRMVSDDFENGVKRTLLRTKLSPEVQRFFVDGVQYWMVVKKKSRGKARCYLVSFDLNKEKFRYIKIPRGLTSKCLLSHCFVKFRGRLALSVPTYRGGYKLSLHVMEDDEGNEWTKHSIPLPEVLNYKECGMFTIPVGNLPDGQMLVVNPLVEDEFSKPIYSYDYETCKFERLCVGKFPSFDLRDIAECAANISCVEENLTPFDVLFNGAKPT